jgi:uridine phosphorylase
MTDELKSQLHKHDIPILEYDTDPKAVIQPDEVIPKLDAMPERVVMTFFREVIASACANAPIIAHLGSEMGKHPVYALETEWGRVAVLHAGLGASLSAGFLDEVIAFGGRKFIACGGAGVLADIPVGHVVVPDKALRDEGTSYHYLPPSRTVKCFTEAVNAIKTTLEKHNVPYDVGMTWTTDGIYRETKAMVAYRLEEGCITVEMEASAFFAVAQHRGVTFGQLLYGGDNVGGEAWDFRGWTRETSTREKLFWLSCEAVCQL